jgi:hypothetical protein
MLGGVGVADSLWILRDVDVGQLMSEVLVSESIHK